jgi:hypothetical protein
MSICRRAALETMVYKNGAEMVAMAKDLRLIADISSI